MTTSLALIFVQRHICPAFPAVARIDLFAASVAPCFQVFCPDRSWLASQGKAIIVDALVSRSDKSRPEDRLRGFNPLAVALCIGIVATAAEDRIFINEPYVDSERPPGEAANTAYRPTRPVCGASRCIAPTPPLATPRTRSLCSSCRGLARNIGVGCARHVRGRGRRSIRRLRRASV